jgi:hypothetical protein
MISWSIGKTATCSFSAFSAKSSCRIDKVSHEEDLNKKRRKIHEYHFAYHLSSVVVGRVAGMAIQPQLGIRRQRDPWFPPASGDPRPAL